MRSVFVFLFLCLVFPVMSVMTLAAQSTAPTTPLVEEEKGFTASTQFSGNANASGHVLKLDANVGYNFNRHFGIDIGVPLYFAGTSGDSTSQKTSNNGAGNPYIDLRLAFANPALNYRSAIAAYIPVASTSTGRSTGRVTFDWTNHFDRTFSRLTPFLNAGIANSVPDARLFDRPFTSLGFNAHLEGGATVALLKAVSIGASGYSILPTGEQTIYSKVNKGNSGATMAGSPQHGRTFETNTTVSGTADLTRDHGFSTWLGLLPSRYVECEVGYTRSAEYNLNSVAFSIGLNIGRMLKNKSRH